MRYLIQEVELSRPLRETVVPPDAHGIALVGRMSGVPVAFAMLRLKPGTRVSAEEQVRLLAAEPQPPRPGSGTPESMPSITAAVCTRNRPELLSRCLRSLCGLEARGLDILVVDNGPADARTRNVAAAMAGVRYVSEPRPGQNFARNRALRESSSELLAFVDDDATVDRGWLAGLASAFSEDPEAGAFTGPVLPYELETRAQVIFEQRNGFGHEFTKRRFDAHSSCSALYPCVGLPGSGCNFAFRRDALLAIGGFDEALDTGTPYLPGGDLDALYRVVRAGRALVYEPRMLVYHQHRRNYRDLRRQMWTWGSGFTAFLTKCHRWDISRRGRIRRTAAWWLGKRALRVVQCASGASPYPWPVGLAVAELLGGIAGLLAMYPRSVRRAEQIRLAHS